MAANRSSFAKLQRDRDNQHKAVQKRERKQMRREEAPPPPAPTDESTAAEIIAQVEQLQRDYDAHVIDFDDYEQRKAELLSRLTV